MAGLPAPEDWLPLQLHINNAGDWTGALHARFVAAMQLARADKGALMQRLSQSMAARQSLKGGLSLKQQLSIRPSVKASPLILPCSLPTRMHAAVLHR